MRWMSNSTYEQQLEEHGSLVYTNVGDSMMPLLRERRDLLIVEKRPEGRCKKFDIVLYRRPSGKHILHRIIKVRKDDYIIAGDNRWEREFGVKDEWISGVLTGVVRDGKRMDLSGWKYRMYVFLWCDLFWVRAGILWLLDLPRWIRRQKKKYEAKKQR
jgi:signal peptidase I